VPTWVDMDPDEPYAEVRQIGRWTWSVDVVHGIVSWGPNGGPFMAYGSRAHAGRKAGRKLAAYRRVLNRQAQTYRIETPDG
jgi:hypothetical protein